MTRRCQPRMTNQCEPTPRPDHQHCTITRSLSAPFDPNKRELGDEFRMWKISTDRNWSTSLSKGLLCVIASGEVHTVLCVLFPQTKQTTFRPWRWCTKLGTAHGWLGQIFSPHIEQVAFSEASLGAEKSQRLKNAANRCHTPISLENHVSRKSSTLTQWAVCSDFIGQWNVDIWPAAAPHLW